MRDGESGPSAASRVFVAVTIAVAAIGILLAAVLVVDEQRAVRGDAESVTVAVAQSLASSPAVAEALASTDATAALTPVTEHVLATVDVDYITIMTPTGIRVTHPDPAVIGSAYLGTIPGEPVALTEEYVGTLGASIRTIVPVVVDGDVVGWVAAGVTLENVASDLGERLPFVIVLTVALVVLGVLGAALAHRTTKLVAGDLPANAIRDAVSSHESLRTLSAAMRAQTHEHGNRMHTAVALLELGRTDEAVALLIESSTRSQALLDRVDAPRHLDPTLTALLVGKAAQARELGIEWALEIDPSTPRSVLGPVDSVSVVGNLIDNALDAAAAGPEPRWVDVSLSPDSDGWLHLVVSDSGDGVPADLTARIFEQGFSTKPVGTLGRGVGLPLVRSLVVEAGGTIDLAEGAPTTFDVHLPPDRKDDG